MWQDGSNMSTEDFMKLAIEISKESRGDSDHDDKTDPLVGIVVVRPDKKYDFAFRAEGIEGHHAEYTLLYDRYPAKELKDSEIYVTLEPCNPESRSEGQVSCSEAIWKKGIKKVFICNLDPNPEVYSKGVTELLEHNVAVEMFPSRLQTIFKKLNSKFVQDITKNSPLNTKILNTIKSSDFSMVAINKYIKYTKIGGMSQFITKFYNSGDITKVGKQFHFSKEFEIAFLNDVGYKYLSASTYFMDVRSNPTNSEKKSLLYRGPLFNALDQLNEFLDANFMASGKSLSEQDRYLIKYNIIKEAYLNAILHKDYASSTPTYVKITDSHILITNPINLSTKKIEEIQEFNTSPEPINPTICSLGIDMGYVEVQGRGLLSLAAHKPKPTFEVQGKTLKILLKY